MASDNKKPLYNAYMKEDDSRDASLVLVGAAFENTDKNGEVFLSVKINTVPVSGFKGSILLFPRKE